MDAYEATKIVFSRIQSVDPENASKIMGLLLIQDHGEEDMIRMAFGPESLLESVVVKARNELSLLSGPPSPPLLSSTTVATPRSSSSPSWSPAFSTRNANDCSDDHLLVPNAASNIDFSLQEQKQQALPSGNNSNLLHGAATDTRGEEGECPFYPEMAYTEFPPPPPPNGDMLSWGGPNNGLCSPPSFGWKQCLYYARGYCKKGSACRFLHSSPEDASSPAAADVVTGAEPQLDEQLPMRRRPPSQRLSSSQLMSCNPSSLLPWSSPPSPKCLGLLLQQQQQQQQHLQQLQENQRAAMMVSADQQLKYLNRARMERGDYLGMFNPGSRQIYLTFPADSTFREEDVSNYFSIYGPVQDVRIPHQQKRMFGFVTFVYPETVKLILAKGNPHFVCNSRVLVKPYKEKGKIFDKKLLQQQQLLMERCDFSGCWSQASGGFDCRDPYDLQQLGPRMLLNSKQLLLRRKVEEQQQAAMDLQNAIELQRRQLTGLQLLDPKSHNIAAAAAPVPLSDNATVSNGISSNNPEEHVLEDKNSSATATTTVDAVAPSKIGWDLNASEYPNAEEVHQDLAACEEKPNEGNCNQERFAKSVSITDF